MMIFFLQSGPPHDPSAVSGVPVAWMMVLLIPVLMVLLGTVLGFRALTEIRLAEGRLGGAMRATFAAGLLPCVVILIVCGGGLLMLAEEISPAAGRKEDLWVTLGVLAGLWLSFLMMRGMYREATGWMRPARTMESRNGLTTAAIIWTILGAALTLLFFALVAGRDKAGRDVQVLIQLASLAVLTAGLICGVLGREQKAAKVCAWISGSLFVVQVLVFTS